MELIDNISRLLGDDLKQTLRPGARLKLAASCFSMYAFEALKAELEKIDELDFIFTSPTFVANEVTDNSGVNLNQHNRLHPYYLVYIMPVALHLGGLYEQLLHRLMPWPARPQETLAELVARVEQAQAKQRELNKTQARLAKEKQFNCKVEINATLRQLTSCPGLITRTDHEQTKNALTQPDRGQHRPPSRAVSWLRDGSQR